jgi:enoyl-CoA hydratase/carnithine racemase
MWRALIRTFSVSTDLIKCDLHGKVALLTLNRPTKLNSLNFDLVSDLNKVLRQCDADDNIHVMVVTGSEVEGKKTTAFAAGADISEMVGLDGVEAYKRDFLAFWNDIARMRKPIIGAVNGFALGGGCEIAMMMDILYASDRAMFG